MKRQKKNKTPTTEKLSIKQIRNQRFVISNCYNRKIKIHMNIKKSTHDIQLKLVNF